MDNGLSRPQSHVPQPTDSLTRVTKPQRIKARIQFISLCWCMVMLGWNDGSTGPLLLRIQEVYHVGFAVVSLIFVFACLGFITGACMNVPLSEKVGFGKAITFGAALQLAAYSIQAAAPPFPAFILAYTINGFGMALQDAQANGFVASLKQNPETKMGILHAAYGVGALAAPLVATQFAELHRWSFHFLYSLGIAVINTLFLWATFRLKTQDDCLAEIGQDAGEKGTSDHGTFRQILNQRAVHILAVFILVYVGVEVTLGGWIVTFIRQIRGGGPSSGYISAGFFGGLTVGRVALLWVNHKVGERRAIYLYSLLAVGLELVVWLVPSLVGNGVAISIIGVLLGPIYPIVMNQSSKILPRWLLTGSIGWIAGFGQAGSAVFPFMTGALAQRVGIKSLNPLVVAMMAVMIILWILVPRQTRKSD